MEKRNVNPLSGTIVICCFVLLGAGKGQLAYELARLTNLRIVGVDDDAKRVDKARKYLKNAGVYGSRVTIQYVPSLSELPFPGRFANLVVSERIISQGKCVGAAAEAFRILSPGGIVYLGRPAKTRKKVAGKAYGLAVADGKLFVSTTTGTIHAFK